MHCCVKPCSNVLLFTVFNFSFKNKIKCVFPYLTWCWVRRNSIPLTCLLSDQPQLLAAVKFIAHLVNQQVAHEIIALELLTVLLENPTDDSVEVAVGFVTECGSILQDLSPKGLHGAHTVSFF